MGKINKTLIYVIIATLIFTVASTSVDNAGLYLWDGKITVQVVNYEVLSRYSTYVELVDESTSLYHRIIFNTTVILRDFRYGSIELVFDEETERMVLGEFNPLHWEYELRPEHPFIVNWMDIGTMPHRAISFKDENDIIRLFAITTNNADPEEDERGIVLLIEYPI